MEAIKNAEDVQHAMAEFSRELKVSSDRNALLEKANADIRADMQKMQEAHIAAAASNRAPLGPNEEATRQFEYDANEERGFHAGAITRGMDARFAIDPDTGVAVQLRAHKTERHGTRTGLLDTKPTCEWTKQLHEAVTTRNWVRFGQRSRAHTPACDAALARVLRSGPAHIGPALERIFIDASTEGAETIFDADMPQLEDKIDNGLRIASIFETIQMSAPTVNNPVLSRGVRPYLKAAVTGDDPAKYTTTSAVYGSKSYTAVSMAFRLQVNEEATEDSFLSFQQHAQNLMVKAIVDGEEDVIINGDAATHQDAIATWDPRGLWGGANVGTADHRLHSVGLRARAFDVSNTTDQLAAVTIAKFRALRASLDSPQAPMTGVFIVSQETWLNDLLGLEDFKELHSHGSNATMINGQLAFNGAAVLRGQVGSIDGTPVLISNLLTSDLAATGLYTGTGATTGIIYCIPERFKRMVRQGQRIESARDILRGVVDNVATTRWLFAQLDGATEKNVAYGFNA